jgi:Helix-turn-helix domain
MELFDEHSAARYLGGAKPLSVRTVQRMRLEGTGPRFIKVGAAVRYSRDDLDEFLARNRRSSTSAPPVGEHAA